MFWRSYCSSRLAISQPPLSFPTRFRFGTFTSVKKVSQKGELPLISLIGRVSTPGEVMSKRTNEMPSCFFALSVRTRQKINRRNWRRTSRSSSR